MSTLRRRLHRRGVRIARVAYLGVERSPLAPVLRIPVVQRVKARITYMPAEQVVSLLGRLAERGAAVWVAGGWGVDAIAGRQTRQHYDLDLVTGDAAGQAAVVADVLRRAGFRRGASQHNPGLPMPWRHVWQHDDGYSVEVLPVVLRDPPFGQAAFTTGVIGGSPVPCLSAALQLRLHTGYPQRPVDAADTGVLRACLDRMGPS
jgi:lincosamide nucleotidyltransferase A/C/D/E